MELTEPQKQAVTAWAKEGCGLSEIQKRIKEKFELSPTYMDVRLLLIEMGLNLKDRAAPVAPAPDLSKGLAGPGPDLSGRAAGSKAGGVTVEVDRVNRPGALASGTVTFSDGVTATWLLDEMGRLALDARKKGYRPNDADLQAFQEALSRKLQERGY